MSAIEPLCRLIGIDPRELSREEYIYLEAELFYSICESLKEKFRKQYKEYLYLMKFTKDMEDAMLAANFIRFVIEDILSTNEYTLTGIAHDTNTPEDVIYELILGCNSNPSAELLLRTIELHRSVRSELYDVIMKKIADKYLTVEPT